MDMNVNLVGRGISDMIEAKNNALRLKALIQEEMQAVKAQDQTEMDTDKNPGDVFIKEDVHFPDGKDVQRLYEYKKTAGGEFYSHSAKYTATGEKLPIEQKAEITGEKEVYSDLYTRPDGTRSDRIAIFYNNHKGSYIRVNGTETQTVDFNY